MAAPWRAALLALLVLRSQPVAALQLAVLPGAADARAAFSLGRVAAALTQRGNSVTVSHDQLNDDAAAHADSLLLGEHVLAAFDAVFAQGQPAAGVADFAERLGVPVVRFVESGEALNVLLERPAVLVFPSAAALRASGDVVEEALRLVLPPELARDAEHAAYALIEGRLRALASARASLPDTLVWDPDGLEKVSVVTINQCMQVWFERPAGP